MRSSVLWRTVVATASFLSLFSAVRCQAGVLPIGQSTWRGFFEDSNRIGMADEVRLDLEAPEGRLQRGFASWDGAPLGHFMAVVDAAGGLGFTLETDGRGSSGIVVLQFYGHTTDMWDGQSLMNAQIEVFRRSGKPIQSGPAMLLRSFQWLKSQGPMVGGIYEILTCDGSVAKISGPAMALNRQLGS